MKTEFYIYVLLEISNNCNYSLNAFLVELEKDSLDPIIELSRNYN